MNDPGINADLVDNRVGLEGTQVIMEFLQSLFCFTFVPIDGGVIPGGLCCTPPFKNFVTGAASQLREKLGWTWFHYHSGPTSLQLLGQSPVAPHLVHFRLLQTLFGAFCFDPSSAALSGFSVWSMHFSSPHHQRLQQHQAQ